MYITSDATAASGGNNELAVLGKSPKSFKPFTGDLPALLKRKLVRVLTTYSLGDYFISNGKGYGFEYSLLKDYEHMLNKGRSRRNLQVVLEFIPVSGHRLIPDLMAGWGDIVAAGLTVTPQRGQKVDFTDPYLTEVKELLVSHKRIREITDLKEISGRKVYVRLSSSYHESLLGLNRRLAAQNLPLVGIIPANEFLTEGDILEVVNAGIVDFTVADSHLADRWAHLLPNLKVHRQAVLRQGGQVAWMVRKNSPKLKASLNRFIKNHKKGTLAGNIYFDRYFKGTKWLKNPLVPEDRARFSRYAPLFKKYGERYNIDWVLIAAQAYQESGLDPHCRSKVGAMGLMQVMPSLARDRRIGIKDLHLPENNVHAGVKYLALIRDTHFPHRAMKNEERIRFSLAAYNAGPAKIQKARRLAGKMGYDANKWFRNGEVGALKLVGQQPVRYVSNINKYYIAYWMSDKIKAVEQQEKKKLGSLR